MGDSLRGTVVWGLGRWRAGGACEVASTGCSRTGQRCEPVERSPPSLVQSQQDTPHHAFLSYTTVRSAVHCASPVARTLEHAASSESLFAAHSSRPAPPAPLPIRVSSSRLIVVHRLRCSPGCRRAQASERASTARKEQRSSTAGRAAPPHCGLGARSDGIVRGLQSAAVPSASGLTTARDRRLR